MDIGSLTGQIRIEDLASAIVDAVGAKTKRFSEDFDSSLGKVEQRSTLLSAGIVGLGVAVGGLATSMALSAASGIRSFVTDAIGMNATLETSTIQFQTLMGSADLAKTHVAFLFEFAKKTPFETGPIIQASRMLQTFGGNALNSKEILQQLGDASAATSAPIEALSMWVGRMYSALQAGKPFGEAAMRLQELAVLTPKARAEMENMQKAGASGDEVFKKFQQSIQGFSGAMEVQAATWMGVTSTFKDTINLLGAAALRPLFETMRDTLKSLNEQLGQDGVSGSASLFAGILSGTLSTGVGMAISGVKTLADIVFGLYKILNDHKLIVEGVAIAYGAYATIVGVQALQATMALSKNLVIAAVAQGEFSMATGLATISITGATTALKAFLVTSGPLIVALAGITAAVMVGRQAWAWYSEAKERGAAQDRQNVIDQSNLNRIMLAAGKEFKTLGEATEWARTHTEELRVSQERLRKEMEGAKGTAGALAATTKTLVQQLADQKTTLTALTVEQKKEIEAGLKMNMTTEQVVEALRTAHPEWKLNALAIKTYGESIGEAKKKSDEWREASYKNIEIELRHAQQAWITKAQWQDNAGVLALQRAERQYADQQRATEHNLAVEEAMRRDSDRRRMQALDDRGLRELAKIDDHYKRITKFSRESLQQVADAAWRDFAEVSNASDQYSKEVIQHFYNIAAEAQEAATGVRRDWGTLGTDIKENFKSALLDVPSMITDIFSGNLTGEDLGKKIGGTIGASIGGAIGGYFGGPYGAMLGSAIGQNIGQGVAEGFRTAGEDVVRRVGTDWGTAITEEMGNAIAATAKNMFDGDRAAAEVFHLREILTAAGGLTTDNDDVFLGKLRDVFVMLETGKFTASEAITTLDQNFGVFAAHATKNGQLVSAAFSEIIQLADRMGLKSEEINKFVTEQVGSAIQGVEAVLTGSVVRTEAAAAGVSAAIVGSFDELVRRGMSAADAIQVLTPSIDALEVQMSAAGIAGGSAFDFIRSMATLAADEVAGPAIDAIHGAAIALTGLHNAGILNQEMFAGLSEQVGLTFKDLIDQGYDGRAAMALVAPDIQRLWELQEKFGWKVDDSTQLLIDQALEAGVVGDAHRDAAMQTVDAMNRAAEAMERVGDILTSVFQNAGDAAEAFAERTRTAIESIPRDFGEEYGPGDIIPVPEEGTTPEDFMLNGGINGAGPGISDSPGGLGDLAEEVAGLRRDMVYIIPSIAENAARHGANTAARRL